MRTKIRLNSVLRSRCGIRGANCGIRILVGLIFWAFFTATGWVQEVKQERFEFDRPLMGVEFKIVLFADSETGASEAAEKAFAEIQSFDDALSDYKSGSEMSRLCATAPHDDPVEISNRLYEAIRHSQTMHEHSNGAFDITIGPLSRVWRTSRKRNRLPTDDKVNEALARMGMEHVHLIDPAVGEGSDGDSDRENRRFVKLGVADMQLDFGGIAKGLAADNALKILREAGIRSALVDASGDVVVSDPPPGKEAWSVKIPSAGDDQVTIPLVNGAVATSGDVYQFLEVDGVRYSHLVDPKTGLAITTPRIVTVVGCNGMTCDSLASAISVLGQQGLDTIDTEEVSVQIIEASNRELTEFKVFRTANFPELQIQPPVASEQ